MGALILGIGFNYAAIFRTSPRELLPYVAVGIVTWNFISGCISDGGESFIAGGAMLRQTALPLPLFVMRSFIRNVVNLGHHILIVVLVLLYVGHFPGLGLIWALFGFSLTCLNLMWVMLLVAFLATRFRDVPQIITAVLQIMLFLSPIFWRVTDATSTSPFVRFNPVYYSIESIRQPLLDGTVPASFYLWLAAAALVGWIVALATYNQTRLRDMSKVEVDGLSLYFPVIGADNRSLKRYLKEVAIGGGLAKKSTSSTQPLLVALRDVAFSVRSGDRLGLIGANGSGKTTLLRCLAGAYSPDRGAITVEGRVASLLDLSMGLDPS
eukprot:gene32143-41374_t